MVYRPKNPYLPPCVCDSFFHCLCAYMNCVMKFIGFGFTQKRSHDSHIFKIYELKTTGHMISDISCEYARGLCVARIKRVSPAFYAARSFALFRHCVCVRVRVHVIRGVYFALGYVTARNPNSDRSSPGMSAHLSSKRIRRIIFTACTSVRVSVCVDTISIFLFISDEYVSVEQVNINWIKWTCLRVVTRALKSNQQPYKEFSSKTHFNNETFFFILFGFGAGIFSFFVPK